MNIIKQITIFFRLKVKLGIFYSKNYFTEKATLYDIITAFNRQANYD